MRRAAAFVLAFAAVAAPAPRASGEDPPAAPPPLPEPKLVGPRAPGPERKKALSRYGGNEATERQVAAGLDWLARHALPPEEGGGWDADAFGERCAKGTVCEGKGRGQHAEDVPCPFDDAITALALLAFLGDGHLPGAPGDPYGEVVAQAVTRVEAARDVWTLPLATEALAELEAMERAGRRREAVRANVERLLAARQEDGAWGYCGRFRPGGDVPYTSLVVPALVAARDAGADVPADVGPRVDAWLDTLEEAKQGKLAYILRGRDFGYTPTTSNAHNAFAIRELLGAGLGGARHALHAGCAARNLPGPWKVAWQEKDGRRYRTDGVSMYQWWYGTMGSFQRGGGTWTGWFGALKTALAAGQRKDGCARGSWDPIGTYEEQTGGRVFATALGVLMLEQPYRHRRLRG